MTSQFRSRAILVLGMHRSGTSAVTRVLNLLGVELGTQLMPAAAGNNEGGFWEHMRVVEIHDALLSAFGRSWHDLRSLPANWTHSDAAKDAKAKLAKLIESDFAGRPLWAVKDPRLCRLLPLWHELLVDLGIEPSAVIVLRHPNEVARSLRKRDGFPLDQGRLSWLEHIADAERDSRGWLRSIVAYDDLFSGWRHALSHVGTELAVDWPRAPDRMAGEIDAFLDRGKRHHAVDATQAEQLPGLIQDVYDAMRAVAHGENLQNELISAVDRYHAISDIFAGGFEAAIESNYAKAAEVTAALKGDARERSEAMLLALREIGGEVGVPTDTVETQPCHDSAMLYWCEDEAGAFDEAYKVILECERTASSERLIFHLPSLSRISRLRIDPSIHPGRFDLLGLRIDHMPVENFAERVGAVSQLRLAGQASEHVAIVAMNDDPHVELNVADLPVDWGRGATVEVHVLRQNLPKADLGDIWQRIYGVVVDACTRPAADLKEFLVEERASRSDNFDRLKELLRELDTRQVESQEVLGRHMERLLARLDNHAAELAQLREIVKTMDDERRRTVLQRIQSVFRRR